MLMMTVESTLPKRPVLRFIVTSIFFCDFRPIFVVFMFAVADLLITF